MKLSDLTTETLAARLREGGVVLQVGPFLVRLGTSLRELIEPVHLLYTHYELVDQADRIVDFDIRLDPPSRPARWRGRRAAFYIDGKRAFQPFERSISLPMLEWVVNWCVFTIPNQYLILHAAVVERGGRAAILPGEPGAGKSTLCGALAFRGWRLFSDEVAMMRPGETRLLPVPRPIGLKEQSIEVIRGFEPGAVLGPAIPGTRKGTVAHIQPDRESVERGNESAEAGWIIFPRYEAGTAARLVRMSKGYTLLKIAHDAFNFSTLGVAGFETAADVVDGCACYELSYGDLNDAVGIFHQLAGEVQVGDSESNQHGASHE